MSATRPELGHAAGPAAPGAAASGVVAALDAKALAVGYGRTAIVEGIDLTVMPRT
jgi:hypothetical protein